MFLIVYKKYIPLTTLSSYNLLRKSFPTLKTQETSWCTDKGNFSAFKLMKLLTTKSNFFLFFFYCVKGEDVYFETWTRFLSLWFQQIPVLKTFLKTHVITIFFSLPGQDPCPIHLFTIKSFQIKQVCTNSKNFSFAHRCTFVKQSESTIKHKQYLIMLSFISDSWTFMGTLCWLSSI